MLWVLAIVEVIFAGLAVAREDIYALIRCPLLLNKEIRAIVLCFPDGECPRLVLCSKGEN